MKALLCKERLDVEFVDLMGGIGGSRRENLDGVLHDGKDNISLVFDGCESHRRDHYDHKIECLAPVSLTRKRIRIKCYKVLTQLADVDNAFAGARIRRGTISAGYSQVIPSHPIAKKVLKTNRKRAATMPVPLPVYLFCIALS